jgi:lipopolysaccharide export system permease protein
LAAGDAWLLHKATVPSLMFPLAHHHRKAQDAAKVNRATLETFRWPTEISAEMVSVALLKPERMGTIDLFNYVRHLDANGQTAQRYEIEFWKKVFYPLSCLVMVMLALPFAYLHFRSGGIAGYVLPAS